MPLFYFDLYDGDASIRDRYGINLKSTEEAAEQAAALLPDVIRDVLPAEGSRDVATFVRDQDGNLVHRAALLYRAQTQSRNVALAPNWSDATGILLQSRQAKDRARQLSDRLNANVAELLDIIRQSAQTIGEARASVSKSINAHMR